MQKKLKSRVAAFLLSLQIFLSFVVPVQPFVSMVQAMETTPVSEDISPTVVEPTPIDIDMEIESVDEELSEIEIIVDEEVSATPTVSSEQIIETSKTDEEFLVDVWQTDSDNRTSVTASNVVVGQIYRFPLQQEVQVTFSRLPEQSSKLTIQEIELSSEQQAELGAVSSLAYDITTQMNDGEFAFDLVLPKAATDEKVEVKYADSVDTLDQAKVADNELEVSEETVVIKELEHMTVFVVVSPNPVASDCSDSGFPVSFGDSCYNTIQAAVDAASDGDIISVAAGTYKEQVSIVGKNITIDGAGIDNTIIESPEALNLSFTTSAANRSVVYVNGGDVTIKDLTVDGFSRGNANYRMIGIAFYNGAGTVDGVKVIRIENSPPNGAQAGNAIFAYNDDSVSRSVIVRNSIVNNFQKNGITMNGENLSATVENNDVDCYGVIDFIAQNGIQFGWGSSGNISNNSVNGCSFVNSSSSWNRSSAGILLYDVGDNMTVSGNIITNSDSGIYPYLFGTGLTIDNNTISNNYFGVPIYDDNSGNQLLITNTSFSGNNWDIDNYDPDNIDVRTTSSWSVVDQNNLDQIEEKINHSCSGSNYIHGICNSDDYGTGFGTVRYESIEAPANLGWNVASRSTTPNEGPLDLNCSVSTVYTNENSVAQNWSAVSGVGVKYQRQVTYPSGSIGYFNAGSLNYTPFSVFGSSSGIEGLWKTKVRSYVDVNNNNTPDAGEETSAWSNECNITLDKTAPADAPLLVSPLNNSIVQGASLTNDWSDVSGAVKYLYESYHDEAMENLRWREEYSASEKTATNVADATFWWRVRAIDVAGNFGPWSESWKVTVDNTKPAAPVIQFPAEGQFFQTAPILNQWTIPTDASGIHHYRIEYDYDDHHAFYNGPYRETATNSRSHSPAANEQGGVSFRVQAFDNAGNEGEWSEWRHYFYDATAPAAPQMLGFKNPDLSCGAITNAGVVTVDWSVPSDNVGVVGYNYLIDYPTTTGGRGTWPAYFTSSEYRGSLNEGIHYIKVQAKDGAGNLSAWSEQCAITKDTIAPDVILDNPTNDFLRGIVPVRGSVTDANPHHYWLVIQNQTGQTVAGPDTVNDNQSFTNKLFFNWQTTDFADGVYTIKLEALDAAGNKDAGSSVWKQVTVDNTLPSSLITGPENGGDQSTVYSNDWNGSIVGTAYDATSGVARVYLGIQRESDGLWWNGEEWVTAGETNVRVLANGTTEWDYQLPAVTEDIYHVSSHAEDLSGNIENSYHLTIVFDQTIPEVSLSIDPASPDAANGWYKTQPVVTLTHTDDRATDYIQYQWNGVFDGAWQTYAGPFSPSSEGSQVLYYRAVDRAGNVSSVGNKTISFDQTKPTAPLGVNADPDTSSGPNAKVVWEAATDNIGVDHYVVTWDFLGGDEGFSQEVSSSTREAETNQVNKVGRWRVTVTAYDRAGHSNSASDDIVITDGAAAASLSAPQAGAGLVPAARVLGVDTQEVAPEEEPVAEEIQQGAVNNDQGQVQGASTSCEPVSSYLWLIMLLIQLAVLCLAEYKLNKSQGKLKWVIYAVATVLPAVLVHYLVDASCFDNQVLRFMVSYFYLVALAVSAIVKTVAYLVIDEN